MRKVQVISSAIYFLKEIYKISEVIGFKNTYSIRKKIAKDHKGSPFNEQLSYALDECSCLKQEYEIAPIKKILIDMENIIGSSCYNGNIQNYGGGGIWEGEGRYFRYPVTFGKNDKKWKVDSEISTKKLMCGYYAFGANQLLIYSALYKIIKYLEKEHGFILSKKI